MSIIAWIVLLGMMTAFFQGKLNDQSNPNRTVDSSRSDDGRAEVVLQRNRMGHYVANGTINGVSVTFLLDTGATAEVLLGMSFLKHLEMVQRGDTLTLRQ